MRHALLLWVLILWSCGGTAGQYQEAVDALDFQKFQATFDQRTLAQLLGGHGRKLDEGERGAAAVLVSLGVIDPEDLSDADLAKSKITRYRQVIEQEHPAFRGRVGDAGLARHMADAFNWEALLEDNVFLEVLGKSLADGVLTGYDLRTRGVYDQFPAGLTFIYSQSSLLHMQQLVALLAREDVDAWVYVAPKVSAFLFREDWGEPSDAVVTLPGGIRVVQGREIAVLFEFDNGDDMKRFHELITRFAKKDEKDEAGLIANAWWQPFYYTDQPFEDFEPISLVVVSSGSHEATLTVLEARTDEVVAALQPWQTRVDRVWVNPPFFRFLNGGFK